MKRGQSAHMSVMQRYKIGRKGRSGRRQRRFGDSRSVLRHARQQKREMREHDDRRLARLGYNSDA